MHLQMSLAESSDDLFMVIRCTFPGQKCTHLSYLLHNTPTQKHCITCKMFLPPGLINNYTFTNVWFEALFIWGRTWQLEFTKTSSSSEMCLLCRKQRRQQSNTVQDLTAAETPNRSDGHKELYTVHDWKWQQFANLTLILHLYHAFYFI